MKTKLKQTNGITLIALIITIIILLILAMVTIRILMNQGIIKHAEKATEAYSAAQSNETEYLTHTEGEMDKYAGGSGASAGAAWTDNGDGTISKGTVTAQIGDYINYDCGASETNKLTYWSFGANNGYTDYGSQGFEITSNPKWKILGINDNGNILITTSDPVQTKKNKAFYLYGKTGYMNGQDELDAISEIFGHGSHAEGARSMTVEDVNKITGYIPPTPTKYTYTKKDDDGKIYRNDATSSRFSEYWYYEEEWKELATGATSPEIAATHYTYTIGTSDNGQKMLRYKDNGSTAADYWLTSRAITCEKDRAVYGLREVVDGMVYFGELYHSYHHDSLNSHGVRPVVTLASDVSLEYDSTNNIWKIK